jgi:signal transduction histidine kinase
MPLTKARIQIDLLVADVVGLYEHIAEEKAIAIETEVAQTVSVEVDAARMRQVFANLLDNALKYTPAGGRVAISVRRDNDTVEISFHDTGPGIAAVDLPRIWDRLYRADKSRNAPGLGLGLSLVKAVVQAHHGEVAVESEGGNGCAFTVDLPIDTPRALPGENRRPENKRP